jgi:hypothetical protein
MSDSRGGGEVPKYPEAMRHQRHDVQGAWVPFLETRRDDDRIASAMEWILGKIGTQPLVVISPDKFSEGNVSWNGFREKKDQKVTSKSRDRFGLPSGYGGVLAYLPYERELDWAARKSEGKVLCVVEAVSMPVVGWARDVQAVNLDTGETPPPYSAAIAELLDDLCRSGNNGWGPERDRIDAKGILERLHGPEFGNTNDIRAVMAGRDFDDEQIKTLCKLAKQAGFAD